jgi:hypothetical protein
MTLVLLFFGGWEPLTLIEFKIFSI